MGIGFDDVVLVSVAGSALHKGWQYLVEAVSMLDDGRKCNIKIIIVGNLPTNSIVERYVVSKGMQDNVIFYGFIRDVRDVVSIADLGFVLSTEVETISFACREMMALGKPVMVSDYAGLPENIDDKVNGWIVQAGDAHSIKVVLEGLKGADLKRMSSNARLKAASEFGEADFIKKTYQIYKLLS
ncbi:MAG TPA: glycosyltransferase [Rhodospirillales bacterium]|nr:glycosyltransferase [Rhodospirillales bacterium]